MDLVPCISHLAYANFVGMFRWDGCLALTGACCLQQKLVSPNLRGVKSSLALNVWLGLGFKVGALHSLGGLGFLTAAASGVASNGAATGMGVAV